jgi:hypothetical protein
MIIEVSYEGEGQVLQTEYERQEVHADLTIWNKRQDLHRYPKRKWMIVKGQSEIDALNRLAERLEQRIENTILKDHPGICPGPQSSFRGLQDDDPLLCGECDVSEGYQFCNETQQVICEDCCRECASLE